MSSPDRTWVADPRFAWTPTIRAARPADLDAATLRSRLEELNERLRPGSTTEPVVETETRAEALRRSSRPGTSGPVVGGLTPDDLVVSVDHSVGDGLSLLATLTALTGVPLRSGAAGVGDRSPQHGFVAARVRRLAEVALAPPAVVPPSVRAGTAGADDAFASRVVDGAHGTAAVIAATAAACREEVVGGRAGRRTRIAVGLSTVPGSDPRLGDHSALLRLAPASLRSAELVREALRTQGVEPPPGDETYDRRPGLARLTTRLQGVLSSRLGSTVLVSHLGRVDAGLADLAFYPVSGGGSGLALGAVVQEGRTTLAARARGAQHDREGLDRILDAVADRLR
jgi:hypothetical protein